MIKGGEPRLLAKERMMAIDDQNLPELVKEIRRQLALSPSRTLSGSNGMK